MNNTFNISNILYIFGFETLIFIFIPFCIFLIYFLYNNRERIPGLNKILKSKIVTNFNKKIKEQNEKFDKIGKKEEKKDSENMENIFKGLKIENIFKCSDEKLDMIINSLISNEDFEKNWEDLKKKIQEKLKKQD